MSKLTVLQLDRRRLLFGGAASLVAGSPLAPAFGAPKSGPAKADFAEIAKKLLQQNAHRVTETDRAGIVDYAAPSWSQRFHLVDMINGEIKSFLVAHGRGSDPKHTGWLQHFSNTIGSNASSNGAYLTGDRYNGKYGRAMRLSGLDPENSNAENRAIVVHAAWYAGSDMIQKYGKLGRSEGCFALSEEDRDEVVERLGPGRLLFAGKFQSETTDKTG